MKEKDNYDQKGTKEVKSNFVFLIFEQCETPR